MSKPLPVFFVSHGGGPWPWMADEHGIYADLRQSLQDMVQALEDEHARPRAIVMLSAHWEAEPVAIMSAEQPGMVYDYHGFPAHTYELRYEAAGDPQLARRLQSLLLAAGIEARLDDQRGFDHGAFVPLAVMYPQADVPVVQLSLRASLDPAAHWALGLALAPLRQEGVLIIGSGLSYHNLRLWGALAQGPSRAFDRWLQETLAADPVTRQDQLLHWERAPSARVAHPREEHLLPLLVVAAAAGRNPAQCIYHEDEFAGGVAVSSFRFG